MVGESDSKKKTEVVRQDKTNLIYVHVSVDESNRVSYFLRDKNYPFSQL